jgi:L-malate glycosyltransferase
MKVLMIGNAYPTERQVCAVWMKRMADQIVAQGHELDLLVIRGREGTPWSRLRQYMAFYPRLALRRLSGYDCIYVHQVSHCFLPLLARRFGRGKLIVHLHGTDLLPSTLGLKGRLTRALTLHACRRADLVVVPSEYFARTLRRFLEPRRLHLYPSGGIDVSLFTPAVEQTRERGATLQIGCVCHLVKGKGVDVLLEAVASVSISCRVTIVGDGPERSRLERQASAHLKESVEFVGPLAAEDVPDFLRSLDLFVFPTTLRESLGLVALEAMGCGVPVIGSRIGALPEYIEHGVNGFLFEPGNAAELATMLEIFSHLDDKGRKAMRMDARHTAMGYDAGDCAQRLLSVFASLVCEAA